MLLSWGFKRTCAFPSNLYSQREKKTELVMADEQKKQEKKKSSWRLTKTRDHNEV